jgi:deoxyribonuclease (pyrimidine dimer)
MSTGHVLFFYDKMYFLWQRYLALDAELRNRNYDIQEHDAHKIFFEDIPVDFIQDYWNPSADEISTNAERIIHRLNERPDWYRHWGKVTPPAYFEALYRLQIDQLTATC